MFRKTLLLAIFLTATKYMVAATDIAQLPAKLSAAEIADRNIAARGGLQSWRSVQTLLMSGQMEAGGDDRPAIPTPVQRSARTMPHARPHEQAKLPFVMELQRPGKSRIEIQFKGQTAIQVFDGTNGWKLRPFLNRKDVESFTAEEMKTASFQSELDGPIADYAVKGTTIELDGIEKVEDRDTYKLKLTLKDGKITHVWIDSETYLEAKVEGAPRRLDGKYHKVEVYFRDYRSVAGLKIPYILETKTLDVLPIPGAKIQGAVSEKIILDKVEVNPKLSASLFSRPEVQTASNQR